jgi:hypothetical protein
MWDKMLVYHSLDKDLRGMGYKLKAGPYDESEDDFYPAPPKSFKLEYHDDSGNVQPAMEFTTGSVGTLVSMFKHTRDIITENNFKVISVYYYDTAIVTYDLVYMWVRKEDY